jgi:transposase
LPDRDAETVKTWLKAHPGVELVSRDRWSAYAQAAPDAQHVADRWHLLKNVREAVERLFERHRPVITDALKPAHPDPERLTDALPVNEPGAAASTKPVHQESLSPPAPAPPREEATLAKRQRRVGRFEQVHELRRQGLPIRAIARELDISRKTVRRYLRCERCPDWRPGRATHSGMDTHREWIDARIAEGRINASELHRELASRGVRLSYATVRRFLTKRLGRAGKTRPRVNAAKPKAAPPPSPKQLSFDWVRRPEKRTVEAQGRLDAIRAASPDLSAALDLADEFTALIRRRSTGTLKEWLSRAEVNPCPEVRNFAEGIRRDESAVNAAVTTRWSNGPVEGQVNRLKTIKRQMYGRAGFDLLSGSNKIGVGITA